VIFDIAKEFIINAIASSHPARLKRLNPMLWTVIRGRQKTRLFALLGLTNNLLVNIISFVPKKERVLGQLPLGSKILD